MAQQLGVILTPFGANGPGWYAEINRAYGGKGTYLPQPGPHPTVDRFHNSRGEVGWYYDTQLGAIPTDAELAKTYVCYTPVATGEINAEQGFIPGPWRFGWDPAGKYGPPVSLRGLGQDKLFPSNRIDQIAHTLVPISGPAFLKLPLLMLAGFGAWLAIAKLTGKPTAKPKRALKYGLVGTVVGAGVGAGLRHVISPFSNDKIIGAWQQQTADQRNPPPEISKALNQREMAAAAWTASALLGAGLGATLALKKGPA